MKEIIEKKQAEVTAQQELLGKFKLAETQAVELLETAMHLSVEGIKQCKKQKNTFKDSLKMLDNQTKGKLKPILDLLK